MTGWRRTVTTVSRFAGFRNVPPHGATIIEVLVGIGIVSILLSLIVPAVQSSRESARATSCRNKLKQIALAAHSYESSHKTFPYTSTAWVSDGTVVTATSPHMGLVPYLDEAAPTLLSSDFTSVPVWNTPWPPKFYTPELTALQGQVIPVFRCPSDEGRPGATHFRANLGISVNILPPSDTIENISQRGAFVNGLALSPGEFADGLSSTVLFSERVLGDFHPTRYSPFRDVFVNGTGPTRTPDFVEHCRTQATWDPPEQYSYAGGSWLLGGYLNTWYTHVLTPNSRIPDCSMSSNSTDGGPGIVSARSRHRQSVHAAMADGSVHVVSDSIGAEVWTAMGSRNGND